jgi:hypothetical protein
MFGVRYVRFIRSLPCICPALVPTFVGSASLSIMLACDVLWPAILLGILLLVLLPQWDSCIFGLMDFMVCILLVFAGLVGILKLVAG